ncbi:unnamed protein product [Choristocarpus tenellus]
MCKEFESTNLQQFEALMSLTNLGSLDEVKNRIVAEKGISTFHYLQCSDHTMVRRAATEALLNLFPHIAMYGHLKQKDPMKLFSAFCQLGEEDPQTAAAALGCVAMGVQDEEVANNFLQARGCESLVFALESRSPEVPNAADLILRAAVACMYLAENPTTRPMLTKDGILEALQEAREHTLTLGEQAIAAASACKDAAEKIGEAVPVGQ